MNKNNIKNKIFTILAGDKRIWTQIEADNQAQVPDLNQTLLFDLLEKADAKLITLLLQDSEIKAKFFVKIENSFVFKNRDFQFFIQRNKVNNSYTQYKNRLGLSDGKRFLKENTDVVLSFPFKDCVLEGGQSTEEGEDVYFEYDEKVNETQKKKGWEAGKYNRKTDKRKEIFFNEIMAQDEIDRLEDEKALVKWKRYNAKGTEKVTEIRRDAEGTIKENLIIKGNNYLALHSLKKQFYNKIKLIYIDPPYNTGGNANIFTYNNNFNHSTWLTFMKNRLEIAKTLLRDDGFIAIAIDHYELFYLGVLADEIFGRKNFLGNITVVHKPDGRQFARFFGASTEYMIIYAKNENIAKFNKVIIEDNYLKTFNLSDKRGKYKLENFIMLSNGEKNLRINKPKGWYPIYVSADLKNITLQKVVGYHEIYPKTDSGQERTWKTYQDKFEERLKNNTYIAERNKNGNIEILEKYRAEKGQTYKTHWIEKKYNATTNGTRLLDRILGRKDFSYPKSLYTVLDTLKIMTEKDDIILDFFAGSGTTGHAVLALNREDGGSRKFILVEQLDKHIAVCVERLQKVMVQENMSDDFIYFELAKWNETAKEKILDCESLDELKSLFGELAERYFLHYNLKIKAFRDKVINEENFIHLTLAEQKKIFIAMLDNNQLYVNRTEMADSRFGISAEAQKLTGEFYK